MLLFQILAQEPDFTATQLRNRAGEIGIELTLLSAYRTLNAFRKSCGKLEDSETRCLKVVATILQEAQPNDHLGAVEIKRRALERKVSLHQSTIYRVLSRLESIGMIASIEANRQKLYVWRRSDTMHGHLTCVSCGKTVEFEQEKLEEIGKEVSSLYGFDFSRIEFTLRSLCQQCKDSE
jgi:Fur family ferric uptake transcriptional regulator